MQPYLKISFSDSFFKATLRVHLLLAPSFAWKLPLQTTLVPTLRVFALYWSLITPLRILILPRFGLTRNSADDYRLGQLTARVQHRQEFYNSLNTHSAPSLRAYLGARSKTSTDFHLSWKKLLALKTTSFSRRTPTKTTTDGGISAMKKKKKPTKNNPKRKELK